MPQGIEDVRVIPRPGHHIHATLAGGRLVFLADAGIHGADVHDLDGSLDADLGELRLEDLGEFWPITASPHDHRRLERFVGTVAKLVEERLGLFGVVIGPIFEA